jgi:site-specific recombinase XerD
MQTTLSAAIKSYLRMHPRSRSTRNEYQSTVRKWEQWGRGGRIEDLQRKDIRDFLGWVYERALEDQGTNRGRTSTRPASTCGLSFPGPGSKS